MKIVGTTLFALFLLSTLILHLPSARSALVDLDGQPLQNGGVYYILPVFGGGGGITTAATGNETYCRLTVVRHPFDKGMPVKISSLAKIGILGEELNVDLEFAALQLCASTPRWTIVDGLPEGHSVKLLGGYQNTVDGWFRIRGVGFGDTYKLVFCPKSSDRCSDIGVHHDSNGFGRLVVKNNDPLTVVFRKFSSIAAAA